MTPDDAEEKQLQLAALQNVQSVQHARQRAEQELVKTKEALAAIAIDNARLYEEVKRSADEKAVLLDAEARDAVNARSTAGYGHWRSGVLYLTALLRQFEAQGDLYGIENWAADAGQDPMSPPNVFSFYHPDYRITAPDNLSYSAPEAMTFTTVTAIRRINFANDLIRDGKLGGAGIGVTTLVTSINIADYQNVALDTTTLINLVNQRLLHGEMSTAMRVEITNAVNAISATDTPANRLNRARTALFLTAASNEYQVER